MKGLVVTLPTVVFVRHCVFHHLCTNKFQRLAGRITVVAHCHDGRHVTMAESRRQITQSYFSTQYTLKRLEDKFQYLQILYYLLKKINSTVTGKSQNSVPCTW
jgi:hypothetical protein